MGCAFPGASACPLVKAVSWCVSGKGFLFLSGGSVCFDCPQSGPYPSLRCSLLASSALGSEVIEFLSSCFLHIKEKEVLVVRSGKFINELTLKKKNKKQKLLLEYS